IPLDESGRPRKSPGIPVLQPIPVVSPNRPDPVDERIRAQPGPRLPVVLEPAPGPSPAERSRPQPPPVSRGIPIWIFVVGGLAFFVLVGMGIGAWMVVSWIVRSQAEESKTYRLEQRVQPIGPPDPAPFVPPDPGGGAEGIDFVSLTRTKSGPGIEERQRQTW